MRKRNWSKKNFIVIALVIVVKMSLFHARVSAAAEPGDGDAVPSKSVEWAEIRVVDAVNGIGVPLVELETVNGLIFVTDNAGRVAFSEPGLMEVEVFLTVRSHGYEVKPDGFGYQGVRVVPQVGKPVEIKITRTNIAERLCRLTGEGRFRDSQLLGYKPPRSAAIHSGKVAGQDSIQAAIYCDKVYWFWGDTLQMSYLLGLFRTAGATSLLAITKSPIAELASGIDYDYFTNPQSGFARAMLPLPERPEGVIWIDGVFVVPDTQSKATLVCHYSRRQGLEKELEQGIAAYHDEKEIFEPVKQLPLTETWRRPHGHPIAHESDGRKWILFGSPTPNVRVPATLSDVLDQTRYEAFTCAKPSQNGSQTQLELDADGKPIWRWQKDLPPVDSKVEHRWITDKRLKPQFARFVPADAHSPEDRVVLHNGSVRWNEFRQCWIMLAGQLNGKSSVLGEIWFAESTSPTGPFLTAVKVVTHDRQSFYNVCHHSFLDRDGGRTIFFEGTYTSDFSGNPHKTPRYNYNQILYRLDLDSHELKELHEKGR